MRQQLSKAVLTFITALGSFTKRLHLPVWINVLGDILQGLLVGFWEDLPNVCFLPA